MGVFAAPIWGYLAGQQLSNDGVTPNTKLDISAGFATDSTQTTGIVLPAFTKTVSGAWVAGSGNAGMGTGLTISASTWYHVFSTIISGAPDVFFDTSVTAAHAPAGTTAFRRIGSILTDGSSHILPFTQLGNEFLWKTPPIDVNGLVPAATQTLYTISTPLNINVWAIGYAQATYQGSTDGIAVYAPDIGAQGANAWVTSKDAIEVTSASTHGSVYATIRTNTSSQIAAASAIASATLFWVTLGWLDTRGQDG